MSNAHKYHKQLGLCYCIIQKAQALMEDVVQLQNNHQKL